MMANPFPGMNPYLEERALWPQVHARLIVRLADALLEVLPPRYTTTIEERMIITEPRFDFQPDVMVVETPRETGAIATSTLVADAPLLITSEETRQRYIEILDTEARDQVVTVIELLSPYNKRAGEGRRDYLAKQQRMMQTDVSFLEIDLLREGQYSVAASESLLTQRDYIVCLHRAEDFGHFQVWPRTIRERLPRVLVPLRNPDPDVVLDIGAAVNAVYDSGAFSRRINYNLEPDPPLSPEDAAWSDALLREKGLRP